MDKGESLPPWNEIRANNYKCFPPREITTDLREEAWAKLPNYRTGIGTPLSYRAPLYYTIHLSRLK